VECIKCGHDNPADQEVCSVCKLVQSSVEHVEDGSAHPVYHLYVKLRKGCEAVASGASSPQEFKKFLDDVAFKMARNEQELREVDIPPETMDGLREELEVGFDGIALYNQAMQKFHEYADKPDAVTMRTGLELAWAGNDKINQARLINRRNRQAASDAAVEAAGFTEAQP